MPIQSNWYYSGIGSRDTPVDVCEFFTATAQILSALGLILRSGGAEGADQAFELGAGENKEIWLPWLGFEGNTSQLLPSLEAFRIASRFHPRWEEMKRLKKRRSMALHARNTHQVLGADLQTPSKFVICWTKDGSGSGGTGQAIRIAKHHKIPVFDFGKRDVGVVHTQFVQHVERLYPQAYEV